MDHGVIGAHKCISADTSHTHTKISKVRARMRLASLKGGPRMASAAPSWVEDLDCFAGASTNRHLLRLLEWPGVFRRGRKLGPEFIVELRHAALTTRTSS